MPITSVIIPKVQTETKFWGRVTVVIGPSVGIYVRVSCAILSTVKELFPTIPVIILFGHIFPIKPWETLFETGKHYLMICILQLTLSIFSFL